MSPPGQGNFGSVMRGTYRWNSQQIPVAVKTLKQDEVGAAKVILLDVTKYCLLVHAGMLHIPAT